MTRSTGGFEEAAWPVLATPSAQVRPSLLRCAPVLVLFAIVMADAMRGADTDLWSHIYFGRIVLAQHQFLFHAPASYACPPGPSNWPNLEWLGGVVLSFVYDTAGAVGLKLAKFASVAAIMVLIALGEGETGASLEVQAMVLMGSAVSFMPQMQFRPVLATYLFFAALMTMFARESYGRHAPLWLAVPMFALWANLHGGFFVGLVALGLYSAICSAQDLAHGRGTRRAVRLTALTSAAALATLLNPYGLNDWLMIIPYLRNPFTLRYISEFRPLLAVIADFHRATSAAIHVRLRPCSPGRNPGCLRAHAPCRRPRLIRDRGADDCNSVVRCAQHRSCRDRLLHPALPPRRSINRLPAISTRYWRGAPASDLARVARLSSRRGRRPRDPYWTAVEDTARGRGQTGRRAGFHAKA